MSLIANGRFWTIRVTVRHFCKEGLSPPLDLTSDNERRKINIVQLIVFIRPCKIALSSVDSSASEIKKGNVYIQHKTKQAECMKVKMHT